MITGQVLLTGGCGTLGTAIVKRATEEEWDCKITVFSRDAMKHLRLKNKYPHVQSIIGDIRDPMVLYNAMVGKDYVLHLAAVKHIPVSEYNSIDTFEINVTGSLNVCNAALQLGTPHILGITTDKSCHPANAYGATKYLMEKCFQEFARLETKTQFHLVRYGNVIESNGSVVQEWKRAVENGEPVKITDPAMTRFWLSPSQAVDYVIASLELESGHIYIPKTPALSIGKLLEYTIGDRHHEVERVDLRPGEKLHETLLTCEETHYSQSHTLLGGDGYFILNPTTSERVESPWSGPYTSDTARELTEDELKELLADV